MKFATCGHSQLNKTDSYSEETAYLLETLDEDLSMIYRDPTSTKQELRCVIRTLVDILDNERTERCIS